MKIYAKEPENLIRVSIQRQLEPVEYFTLHECTTEEVETFVKKLIKGQNLDPFFKGKKTQVVVRNAIGGKNGKSKSISFYGLSPQETAKLIINEINKQNEKS